MNEPSANVGDVGRTCSPMRPFGEITIDGYVYQACCEEGWLDSNTEIVLTKSSASTLRVRRLGESPVESSPQMQRPYSGSNQEPAATDRQTVNSKRPSIDAPPMWIERCNPPLVGAILWTIVGYLIATPPPDGLNYLLAVLPIGGAVWGFIIRFFIRGARDLAGPYGHQRGLAHVFLVAIFAGSAVGVAVAIALGGGIVWVTLAMNVVAVAAGILTITLSL